MIYQKLQDSFSRHDGSLEGYSTPAPLTGIPSRKHYNLRSMLGGPLVIPWTMGDMRFYTLSTFSGQTMTSLDDGRVVAGTDEQWNGTGAFTVAPDPTYRYANTLTANISVGTPLDLTSGGLEDIQTDFQDENYFIEILLRNFPAQAAACHLNLTLSTVSFVSAIGTDTIRFDQSAISLTGGGDATFKINRSLLVSTDLTAINNIDFHLVAAGTGSMVFRAQTIRMIPGSYIFKAIDVDNKQKILTRSLPEAGGIEPSVPYGWIYFSNTRPENTSYVVKFNSGNNPTGLNSNIIRLAFRYDDLVNENIIVTLAANTTQSTIDIVYKTVSATTTLAASPITTNILTQNTEYILGVDLIDDAISVTVWNTVGGQPTTILYGLDAPLSVDIKRGYIGFSFEPYNYNFVINYIGPLTAEFATFESTIFNSFTPVVGNTLIPLGSPNIDLIAGTTWDAYNDVALTPINDYIRIAKTGVDLLAGGKTTTPYFFGTSRNVQITGEIFVEHIVRGSYWLVLADANLRVFWMQPVTGLLRDHWIEFKYPLNTDLPPEDIYLYFFQIGSGADTFRFRNFSVLHAPVKWSASSDAGQHWQPLLFAINEQYSGVKFLNISNQLKIQAKALSDQAWIQGYETVPIYGNPGKFLNKILKSSASQDIRVIGKGIFANYNLGMRIIGTVIGITSRNLINTGLVIVDSISAVKHITIVINLTDTGLVVTDTVLVGRSATTQDLRIIGSASAGTTSTLAQDIRMTGQSALQLPLLFEA